MIHCVTQQQPVDISTSSINKVDNSKINIGKIYPNPVNKNSTIEINLKSNSSVSIKIYDISGREVKSISKKHYLAGENSIKIDLST